MESRPFTAAFMGLTMKAYSTECYVWKRKRHYCLVGRREMPRFSKRQLQWTDIIGRFEGSSYFHHLRNALGTINLLEEEGAKFWQRESKRFKTWQSYCTKLRSFLSNLHQRRDLCKQGLETAMREFIQEFEHSTGGLYEMLYGTVAEPGSDEGIKKITDWFSLVGVAYLASTYALVSAWNDDKQEPSSLSTIINLTTGEMKTEGTRTPMRVPKKYQKSTRRL